MMAPVFGGWRVLEYTSRSSRAQGKRGKGGPANTVGGAGSEASAEYLAILIDNTSTRQTHVGAGLFRVDTATEGDGHQAVSEVRVSLERRSASERPK
jgi:hypothetical protein